MVKSFCKAIVKKRWIIVPAVTALLVIFMVVCSTKAYEVRVDNKLIGIVKSRAVVQNMTDAVVKNAEGRYGTKIIVSSRIDCKEVYLSGKKTEADLLGKQLENVLKFKLEAFAINVNGTDLVNLKDKQSAEEVLNRIKTPYVNNQNNNTSVGFVENVSIIERAVTADEIKTAGDAYSLISQKSDKLQQYTVKEGDTVSGIAAKFGVGSKDIRKANPGINIDSISIGQKLNLTVPRYTINVKQSTAKTYNEKVPFEVKYENSQVLYKGNSKVKVKGAEGQKQVKAEQISVNGILEETRIVSENITTAPKAEIVLKGTKARPRTLAYGVFAWPSRGSLTSRFGERWSREHTGIDIAAPRGTPNRAADGGVVIFAGRSGSYGKLIIINHENGYTTYYGHNNTILVKKGQRVARGEIIGTVGATGRATGPHLHFEIRKNGVPQNPLKYIG